MANNDETQRAQRRSQRERQYEIDRITEQYVVEFRAGGSPRIEDYVQRYPQYTRELLEFALYFHTIGFDAAEPDEAPAAALSPASQKALARIREQGAAASTASTALPPPIVGLVKQGVAAGYTPRKLAEAVGLTTELLAKLEARAIAVATIPPTLVRRLADTLKVDPGAIAAFLGMASPGQAGAFYYADQPPTQQQESFLDAVQASTLSPDLKSEWAEIVQEDAGRGA